MQLPETVEVKGMRVLTSKQLAECYGTTTAMIKKNFSNNRERYLDGKHYISLTGDDLKAFKKQVTQCNLVENDQVKKVHLVNNQVGKSYLVDGRASHLYLWTEKGALLHAKSLNTDKAWEVYDYLVDFYFRAKEKVVEPEKKEKTAAPPRPLMRTVVDIPENPRAQEAIKEIQKAIAAIEVMLDESNRYIGEEVFRRYRNGMADAFQALMVRVTRYLEIVPGIIEKQY